MHIFFKTSFMLFLKLELEKSWYAEKVGAGLHIVAAVTESCVTGHAINCFRGSNYVCGWSEVSNKEDGVLSQVCSILQFGENREEVIMGRRSRKCKLRPTGGRAISTSPCLGRWLRGSGMALKVTLSFLLVIWIYRFVSTTIFSWCQFKISLLRWTISTCGERCPLDSWRLKACLQVQNISYRIFESSLIFYRVLVYKEESKTLVSILIGRVDFKSKIKIKSD